MNAAEWTGKDMYEAAQKNTAQFFNAEDREDAMQEFAMNAWIAQQKLDPEKLNGGTGAGYVWQYANGGIKNFLAYASKHNKPVVDGVEQRKVTADVDNNHFQAADQINNMWEVLEDTKEANPFEAILDSEENTELREALKKLTKIQGKVIYLHFAKGLSFRKIAKKVGYSVEGVCKIRDKALDTLRAAMC